MPRRTSKSKKSEKPKTGDRKKKPVEKKQDAKFTVEDIIEKAQACIDTYDFDMAQKYCQKGLEMENDNINVLHLTGHVMMEVGNMEAAKQCYGRLVELEPEEGHLKYLYLGQMMDGMDAVNCYRKAIQVMLNNMESQENKSEAPSDVASAQTEEDNSGTNSEPTVKDVSSAYLSIAELYMTDLCDEEDAEDQCIGCIRKAIEHDETNPEGYQVLADYHLVKAELEEAKTQIKKSISLWLPSARQLVNEEENSDSPAVTDPVDCLPITPEAQLKAAKTLIEVEEYNDSTDILELLLDQDDTVVDVWYLIGWANYLQGDDYKQTSKYYLERCKEVSLKTKYEDKDVMAHVDELLQELSSLPDLDEEPQENLENLVDNEEEMDAD